MLVNNAKGAFLHIHPNMLGHAARLHRQQQQATAQPHRHKAEKDMYRAGGKSNITMYVPRLDVLAYLASELCSWKPQLRYSLLATCGKETQQ